jgi:glyoxylase-like metal-dependent hydrolase (beta-lactamase superfamily II)
MVTSTDGKEGLVVDPGSGAITECARWAGVEKIEWALHTHHHRDQCWGTSLLQERGALVAVPEHERHLFEQAETFWQTRRVFDNYDNRNTFFTTGSNIRVDEVLEDYEEFAWRDLRFFVLPAKGHTYGSSVLVTEIDGVRVAFTGDLMSAGGRLYQLHAMEYVYGGMEGALFTLQSLQALRKRSVDLALPSHGDRIENVEGDIDRLERRLIDCARLGRGMNFDGVLARRQFAGTTETLWETVLRSKPKLEEISPHLLWGGPLTCSNFYVVLSESGKAMFIDYGHAFYPHLHELADHEGLETARFIEHRLDELREHHGVTQIDLVVPTHIHDDHTCGIPYLQRHHSTRCWALEEVGRVLVEPDTWASTPCLYPKPIRIDRFLKDGERFRWEEFEFTIHYAPGQTEFHSVLEAKIDSKIVAFTGDNYLLHEVVTDEGIRVMPYQTTVPRNSFQLWMHRRCAEVMEKIRPNLICPGHGDLLPCDDSDIVTYRDFIEKKERVFRELVAEPADHYIDLFWARLLPYVRTVKPNEQVEYRLSLRNNLGCRATYAAQLLAPAGWETLPGPEALVLEPQESGEMILSARTPRTGDGVRRLITAEVRIDDEGQGPVAEALATVRGG